MSAFVTEDRSSSPEPLVVVVDDDDSSREVVRFLLEEEGYRVASFASPAAALASLTGAGDEIAVLLTDVHLPGMSGPELASRILAHHPDVRIAFVTGDLAPPEGIAG